MFKTIRTPVFWYQMLMWVLSFLLCIFLINFGSSLISDLPTAGKQINKTDFLDEQILQDYEDSRDQLEQNRTEILREIQDATAHQESVRRNYAIAKQGFENWLSTREATDLNAQNDEVTSRTRELDVLQEKVRMAERQKEDLEAQNVQIERELTDSQIEFDTYFATANGPYAKAISNQRLRIFLLRVALTLPLLLIACWLILKKRQATLWPIYRGFVMFAFFAFFVELVPYLPSYGGYVRNGVGIVLSIAFGYYAIKAMRKYMERKSQEEKLPEKDRREKIAYESGIKKMAQNTCPNCDRKIAKSEEGVVLDYCVHCKFCLYNYCKNCDARDNSFYKFCGVCGSDKFYNKLTADTKP